MPGWTSGGGRVRSATLRTSREFDPGRRFALAFALGCGRRHAPGRRSHVSYGYGAVPGPGATTSPARDLEPQPEQHAHAPSSTPAHNCWTRRVTSRNHARRQSPRLATHGAASAARPTTSAARYTQRNRLSRTAVGGTPDATRRTASITRPTTSSTGSSAPTRTKPARWRRPTPPPQRAARCRSQVPDVLSYGEMLDLMADALGVRRRPLPAGAAHHAVAVLALDRTRHPGGRGRRPSARGGPLDAHHRHRQLGAGTPSTYTRCPSWTRSCA